MSFAALFLVAGLVFAVIAWEVWRKLPRPTGLPPFIACPCCGSESRPLAVADRQGIYSPHPTVRWCGVCRAGFNAGEAGK